MENSDFLIDLFKTVTGREPTNRYISEEQRMLENQRLGLRFQETPSSPNPFIPELLLQFLRTFGGEESLVGTYFFVYGPDEVVDGLGHVVFAVEPRSAISFGIRHHMLQFDDPRVMVVETQHKDDIFAWEKYCNSLDDCLVQFACKNLCESLPYDLHIENVSESCILDEVACYPSLALTKSGETGVHIQPYYARGTLICLDCEDNSAMIGFDTLERAIAFQVKHDWGYSETLEESE